ncbi:MAG: hypothetical protein AAF762_07540 [Pseudomonadota bacterium]
MMRRAAAAMLLVALSACGADGDPEPVEPGIRVTGEARIGVSGSF